MSTIFDILTDEKKDFGSLPWWMYAVVIPAWLIAVMAIAGWLDSLTTPPY